MASTLAGFDVQSSMGSTDMGGKRKKRSQQKGLGPLLGIGAVLFVLWLISNTAQQAGSGLVVGLIGAGAIAGVYRLLFAPHNGVKKKLSGALEKHMEALTTRRAQLVYRDAYGNSQTKRWHAEIDHFLANVLVPHLSSREKLALASRRDKIVTHIEQAVIEGSSESPPLQNFSESMTPSQYEAYCAEEMKRHGWDAAVTRGSRDQGVDVVATKAGVRVVLQCKLYSQPVGNKAVQEVVAARNYERARFGIVVSNNSYTAPAQALASANGVHLLHHRELAGLEALLRKSTY
jgi:hypothetical protein